MPKGPPSLAVPHAKSISRLRASLPVSCNAMPFFLSCT
jgi:hypothetical protein